MIARPPLGTVLYPRASERGLRSDLSPLPAMPAASHRDAMTWPVFSGRTVWPGTEHAASGQNRSCARGTTHQLKGVLVGREKGAGRGGSVTDTHEEGDTEKRCILLGPTRVGVRGCTDGRDLRIFLFLCLPCLPGARPVAAVPVDLAWRMALLEGQRSSRMSVRWFVARWCCVWHTARARGTDSWRALMPARRVKEEGARHGGTYAIDEG